MLTEARFWSGESQQFRYASLILFVAQFEEPHSPSAAQEAAEKLVELVPLPISFQIGVGQQSPIQTACQ